MTKDEALKLALEALETPWNAPYVDGCDLALGKKVKAITAIKEALANEALEKMAENARELGLDYEPPQEPVAWINKMSIDVPNQILYTAPQRTWVGLTEDEILLISADCASSHQHTDIHFARAIEAKLRSKNS